MLLIFCMTWMRGNLAMTMTCMVNTTAVSMQAASSMKDLQNQSKPYQAPTQCNAQIDDGDSGAVVNDYGNGFYSAAPYIV
uniref:Secreted protein n=1 Tax=Acrobeloides nanus TaxID=290746 RepID=A0A914E3G6_9BILA